MGSASSTSAASHSILQRSENQPKSSTSTEKENNGQEIEKKYITVIVAPTSEIKGSSSPSAGSLPMPINRDLTPWILASDFPSRYHWFERGDLVEFYRKGCVFNHWAIYIGEGKVAHVTSRDLVDSSATVLKIGTSVNAILPVFCRNPSTSAAMTASAIAVNIADKIVPPAQSSLSSNEWTIRTDDIQVIAVTDYFRIHNYTPRGVKFALRAWDEIEAIINESVGKPFAYSLLYANCEHFATGLRYICQ